MPSGVVPGQQRGRTIPHIADPNVIIAVDVQAPRDAFGGAGEAFRGRLSAIGTDHIDRTGDARRWALVMSLNCSMMDMHSGSFGCGVRKSMLLATQTFSFESKARARTPIPARKLSTLVGSLAGKRTTVSDEELATQTRF